MFDENDDPFELHSRWFLKKLQRAIEDFRRSTDTLIDDQVGHFDNLWPQVGAAFRWASAQSEQLVVVKETRSKLSVLLSEVESNPSN